jgi:phosphatidylserine decarboxylase
MKKLKLLIPFGIFILGPAAWALGAGIAGAAAAVLIWCGGWIFAYWYVKQVHFYRDPERGPDDPDPDAILSPADGRVVYIRRVEDGTIVSEKLGHPIALTEVAKFPEAEKLKSGWLLGVYMSPMDVHFNYGPIEGQVKAVYRHKAKANLPMVDRWEYIRLQYLHRAVDLFAKKFHFENERATLLIERSGGRQGAGLSPRIPLTVLVVLIADKFVNKIKLSVEEGGQLTRGGKLGFIDRGSQADLFIADPPDTAGGPARVEITAGMGRKVYGGKTVVARLLQSGSSPRNCK